MPDAKNTVRIICHCERGSIGEERLFGPDGDSIGRAEALGAEQCECTLYEEINITPATPKQVINPEIIYVEYPK